MKHWQETVQIADHIVRLSQDGRRCALTTVTKIVGSACRRPGAKLPRHLRAREAAVHAGR